MSVFSILNDTERYILKTIILNYPDRPIGFSVAALYGNVDIRRFTENDIKNGLDKLVEKSLLTKKENNVYILSREQFIKIKDYYKWRIRLSKAKKNAVNFIKFLWKHFIVTIITAAITAYITVKIQYNYASEYNNTSFTKGRSTNMQNKK